MSDSQKIKCVVWDLDNTLWNGILSEGDTIVPRPEVVKAMQTFDERGILQSIASRNDFDPAWAQLEKHGLSYLFLYPQIHWNSKSTSIRAIAEKLNIGLDTFAFIDDQPFERDEVLQAIPTVRVFDAAVVESLPSNDNFVPRFLTDDARKRRELYQSDEKRNQAQEEFKGPEEAFLRTLNMKLSLAPARESDLQRAEELTLRTHQLNTTGISFTYEQLKELTNSQDHWLLVAELEDRYGSYGKIGLILVHKMPEIWTIELLLMSCRVMSRGVGGTLITFLRKACAARGVRLQARFRETDRNRMMYITYRFAGFSEISKQDGLALLENDLSSIPPYAAYHELILDSELTLS